MIQSIEAKVWEAREDDDAPARETAQAGRYAGIPRDVLTARAAVVKDRDEGPIEVERGLDQEERLIEVWRLPAKSASLGDPGMRPLEIVQPRNTRKAPPSRESWRRSSPRSVAARSPSALGRELDQHEEERAEGQAQKEQERHEPREEEPLRIRGPQNRAGHRPSRRDAGADDRKAVPRVPGGIVTCSGRSATRSRSWIRTR